ncbi:DUF881 domain-containing protein [Evansella cellulosilytica]|uniref:DUF881 domain-containing protein n=1 Tax=Evansella cellulosilytica (strain ATCC 21833 / DSM 2522 / FERM P-1141 / JCM 9156 / N-4) TaxID=649639 RepID=E6TTS6_EVAC2|nr:DUF881 domain-containing protein [Evansella cellulosilytica]ADU30845.1 protein of unknown function DUF881 [Evansella cellulosilytica DSM 2522]
MKDKMIIFTCVTIIIGFMVAIQFQTTKEPEVRDTRSTLELRQALTVEKERQKELNEALESQLELLYQLQQTEDVEPVMVEAIEELRERAGLTKVSGQGVIIDVTPYFDEFYEGGPIRSVPPYLLRMLVNELNINGAKEIAISNERIVSTTAIREANGVTLINSSRVTEFPLKVRVLTDDPEGLHHAIMSSQSREFFSYENLSIASTPINFVELPAYDRSLRVRHMEAVKED